MDSPARQRCLPLKDSEAQVGNDAALTFARLARKVPGPFGGSNSGV